MCISRSINTRYSKTANSHLQLHTNKLEKYNNNRECTMPKQKSVIFVPPDVQYNQHTLSYDLWLTYCIFDDSTWHDNTTPVKTQGFTRIWVVVESNWTLYYTCQAIKLTIGESKHDFNVRFLQQLPSLSRFPIQKKSTFPLLFVCMYVWMYGLLELHFE